MVLSKYYSYFYSLNDSYCFVYFINLSVTLVVVFYSQVFFQNKSNEMKNK